MSATAFAKNITKGCESRDEYFSEGFLYTRKIVFKYFLTAFLKREIIVRHVTGTGLGLLEEIPRSGVQMSALTLRATIGVRAPYATRRKLRYEANQVWMNTTFISQGPQSSGI
jgi:hypothetical protein